MEARFGLPAMKNLVACANMAHLGCPISARNTEPFPEPQEHIRAGKFRSLKFSN
jgi:hypothetical protein